jgi:tRNA pseudouridine38-40 synthase
MLRNIKLTLAYDGTGFHGWQAQPGLRTVQGAVTEVARRIFREPVGVVGASRTDAGVHARGQVAHVRTDTAIPVQNLRRALGHRLPEDIALLDAVEAPLDFHAIRDARRKLYRYTIYNSEQRPCVDGRRHRTWHVWWPLDVDALAEAAALLVGTHDFTSFASAGSNPRESNVRTILRVDCRRAGRELTIDIEGTGFLYNQVRNMVGTLVEVGRGHWRPERVRDILAARDRAAAGPTAPPQGLCLEWIHYDPWPSIREESADATA